MGVYSTFKGYSGTLVMDDYFYDVFRMKTTLYTLVMDDYFYAIFRMKTTLYSTPLELDTNFLY